MTTGEKLQVLRKKKGYTQEDLAGLLGVSRQSVSKWESDSAFPETEKLIELSKIYDCSIDYLLKQEEEKEVPKEGVVPLNPPRTGIAAYVKRNNFFSACFLAAYVLLELLLYLMPVVEFNYMGHALRGNIYDLINAPNYEWGNYVLLAMFLLHLSLLGLGIAYGFYPERWLYRTIRIVLVLKLLLMAAAFLAVLSVMIYGIVLLILYDIAALILFFVLPKNKFAK